MKVLHIAKYYPPHVGGMERHVGDLCRTEQRLGLDVTVVGASSDRRRQRILRDGVHVELAPSWGSFRSIPLTPGLGRLTRAQLDGLDVVHLHSPNPFGEGAAMAARKDSALVITEHGAVVQQRWLRRLYYARYRRILRRANLVITTSRSYADHSEWLKESADKVRVIPYGLDPGEFRLSADEEAESRRIALRSAAPRILFVGRLVRFKGVEFLIRALAKTRYSGFIVGDGPERTRLEGLSRRLGAEGRIWFEGRKSFRQVLPYYAACDALVVPSISRSESFGYVVLEAAAYGVPTLASSIDTGLSEICRDGQTGILFRPGDAASLQGAMETLFNDDRLRLRLGSNAKAGLETNYSLEATTAAVTSAYHEAVDSVRK